MVVARFVLVFERLVSFDAIARRTSAMSHTHTCAFSSFWLFILLAKLAVVVAAAAAALAAIGRGSVFEG